MNDIGRTHNVTFATFSYSGDKHLLHYPGHIEQMINSNMYRFNEIIVVYQKCEPEPFNIDTRQFVIKNDSHMDAILESYGYDLYKPQYKSDTDIHHNWKNHNVNHLQAARYAKSEYILFCDNDCWMKNPINWIDTAIQKMQNDNSIFIVSPNDGEPERKTLRMSQQMFLVKRDDFMNMDFNQPNWDGNPHIPGGPFPQYWSLLEGRLELYCRYINKYRYVLSDEYRYWHMNRYDENGYYETDYSKY